jgi:excisionase family DNA binding protein
VKAKAQTPARKKPDMTAAVPDIRSRLGIAYRVEQAAELLDIGRTKMWALVYDRRVPAHKIDGATVILHEDLVAFVRAAPLFEPANSDQ